MKKTSISKTVDLWLCHNCQSLVRGKITKKEHDKKCTKNFVKTGITKMKKTYMVRLFCANCKMGFYAGAEITIPQGQRVQDTPCPSCGCKTLSLL